MVIRSVPVTGRYRITGRAHRPVGYLSRNNGNPSTGSSGHAGGTSPGQTHKKPKDLSGREREDRGRGEGGGVYVLERLSVDTQAGAHSTLPTDVRRKTQVNCVKKTSDM